jgi:outer membrane protein
MAMNPTKILAVAALLVPALLSPASPVFSAGPAGELAGQPLTKEEAVSYALAHNRIFKAAEQELLGSGEKVKQAEADFYPKLDGSYTLRHYSDQPYAAFESTRFPISPVTTNRWQVDVRQPLFTGFGLESQLKIAKADRQIAGYRLDEVRLNLVRDVQHTFWQTLLAERLRQVARDNVASLEVRRKDAEANFQQGLVARNDVLKAGVALAQAVQQERTIDKQLSLLRSRLNQLLDIDLLARIELADEDKKSCELPSFEELCSQAEAARPEYLSLETAIRQAELGRTAAKSRYWPQLSGFATYYREGEDFSGDKNPYANDHNAAIGLRVDWNLFEGGKTQAAEKESMYRKKGLEERRSDLKEQIRLQVQDAFEQVRLARANIETSRAALAQAEENERMTSLQYKEQVVIFLEVLNAQVFLAQTRADFYQALYGYQTAMADLERAIGGPLASR